MTTVKLSNIPDLLQLHKSFDPFSVGYDKIFQQLEEMSGGLTKNVSYPPYNIRKVDDKKYVIEMAVAGFAKTDIEITLEGNKLVIKGNSSDSDLPEENFLFKGIANRNFTRAFTIADKIEIKDAQLVNGMLSIMLENIVKVQDSIKKIVIKP